MVRPNVLEGLCSLLLRLVLSGEARPRAPCVNAPAAMPSNHEPDCHDDCFVPGVENSMKARAITS